MEFECPYPGCVQVYRVEKTLRRHIEALHRKNKKYQCRYCTKQLSSIQNLREHQYIHTGERPYQCAEPGCHARFRQGSQLTAHKKVHRGFAFDSDSFAVLKVSAR